MGVLVVTARIAPQPPVWVTDRVEPCRSCGTDIVWCRTEKGTLMPVDAAPSTAGNVAVSRVGSELHAGVVPPRQADGMRAAGRPVFLAHFASCPHADQWRKK